MRLDEQGFFHFVDRVGDTFRWKGENVATSEVNDAIRECPGVLDATTYGVEVPGADGRAGMTAIVVSENIDFRKLADHLARRLPSYAHPLFLRISAELDSTETFKQKKQLLAREGFHPVVVGGPLYFRDPQSGEYRPLDDEAHARIKDGRIRL
jgi:fatty-acyl-CoA synthase